MSDVDLDHLRQWVGSQERITEPLSVVPIRALSATLDLPGEAPEQLPPLWHWLFHLPAAPTAALGEDGHPVRGVFLPPVPLPRRMWAGGRLQFFEPLQVGDVVERHSRVAAIEFKEGRSGPLVFVTVLHRLLKGDVLAVEEQQDLVYRQAWARAPGSNPDLAPDQTPDPQWLAELSATPQLLFRFSALTFNSHRIHYDRDYATGVEGYPALVVHAPLTAMLLANLARQHVPQERLTSFRFRGLRPLFEGESIRLQGRRDEGTIELWALNTAGQIAMSASAELV